MKKINIKQFLKSPATKVIVALLIMAGAIVPFHAASAETLSDKISNLQAQIDQSEAEASRLRGQADNLQNALAVLTAEKNAIQTQVDLSQAKFEDISRQIDENQQKLERQQRVLSNTISDLSAESATSPIELLAGSASIGDFIDRQGYRTSVQDQIQTAIAEVKKLKAQLASQRKEVEGILATQKTQRDQLAAKEAEQAQLLAATRSEEAAYQQRAGDLRQQKAQAEAALAASLSSRSYRVSPAGYVNAGAIVGAVGSTGMSTGPHLHLEVRTPDGNVTNPEPFIKTEPVNMPPAYISQVYGNADPMYARGWHPGTDYAASTGTPIYAIDSGMMYRGCSQQMLGTWAYGYVAIVEHSGGSRSIYAHMSGGPAC